MTGDVSFFDIIVMLNTRKFVIEGSVMKDLNLTRIMQALNFAQTINGITDELKSMFRRSALSLSSRSIIDPKFLCAI
jgi:hypothetical protein